MPGTMFCNFPKEIRRDLALKVFDSLNPPSVFEHNNNIIDYNFKI